MQYISVEQNGFVATVTHVNPPTHTINAAGAEELLVALETLAEQRDVRVVVITGGSDDIFIRHYEVGELATSSERMVGAQTNERPKQPVASRKPRGMRGAATLLEAMDAVTIAAINGMAMGGGLELALACDFRLARAGDFRIGLPETGVGILPGGGGTQRFARMLGTAKALDLILLGQVMTPEQALEHGIVSRVFSGPLTDYRSEVASFAKVLSLRAPRALALSKKAIREGVQMSLEDGLQHEAQLFGELMRTQDAALALRAAFDGKPRPEFTGT